MRRVMSVCFALILLVLGASACNNQQAAPPATLAPVPQRPTEELPSWIAVKPTGSGLPPSSHIRVIFSDDLIPPEHLESAENQDVLSHLHIEPALAGHFALLTPRMIAFVADAPLPPATRVRVTLSKGLVDMRGNALTVDYAWSFQTDALAITTDLPNESHAQEFTPRVLKPELHVFSNAELDTASLLAHAHVLYSADPNSTVNLVLKTRAVRTPTSYDYTLVPAQELQKGGQYRLVIASGVLPAHGNMPSDKQVVGVFTTFGPLQLQGITGYGKPSQNGVVGRFVSGVPQLVFTNGLVADSVSDAISIQPPALNVPLIQVRDGDTAVTLNPQAFLPNTHYTITVAASVRDIFGQTLGERVKQTFDTGALAGNVWAPTGFTIFPAHANPALNIVFVNLLEGEYRADYHVVKPEDVISTDLTDAESIRKLLLPQNAWATFAAPKNEQVVIRKIPLRQYLGATSGVLAYGITGKTNEVLLDSGNMVLAQPRFFGAAERTNIGVFAQWFPSMGLVRAHRLSDGTPIAGASITIYPSHTQSCANGVTDASGTLILSGSAFARCSVVSKSGKQAQSLIVIARSGADWSFARIRKSDAESSSVRDGLSVTLDKATYRLGETARVLVQSPYPQAELFLAVVRDGMVMRKTMLVRGPTPQATFIVTPDMLPNALVETLLVRRGVLPTSVSNANGLAGIGFAAFETALDTKYLKVTIEPEHDSVRPQETQSVRVRVSDAAGHGVRSGITFALVKDGSDCYFPDRTRIVYADEPISTRFADNREEVTPTLPARPAAKGFEASAGTCLRKPIALYNGSLKTDAAGSAMLRFKAPEDLATWRIMAVAFSADARFGNGEAKFITTKPLVSSAVLPQFVRPGDTFLGGVAVTNTRQIVGNVGITGVLTGDLAFVEGDHTTATTLYAAPMQQRTQTFRFPMRVTGSMPANVQFTTILDDQSDAFQEPLDIRTSDVTASVVQTGATDDRMTIPLNIDTSDFSNSAALDVTMANTLLPETQEAVRAALADDTPLATAIAGRLATAADAIVLDRRYKRMAELPALQTALAQNLDALRALQREDGGYALWPGARVSEIYSTAFCAVSLVSARSAGADVAADLRRVRGFLRARLNDPSPEANGQQEPEHGEIRLEALEALGFMGEVRSDHLGDIYAQRKQFSFYENVELARHLYRLAMWRKQATALRNELLERAHDTAQTATIDDTGSSLETATAGQAQLVELLIDSRASGEDIDRAFLGLLDLRHNGIWPCSCDTAEAMNAVVSYAALQPAPAAFTVTAQMPGATLETRFRGYEAGIVTQHIPSSKLPHGSTAVTLRVNGKGKVHYVVAYHYALQGNQPGVYAGIRLERIVHAVEDQGEIARFGLRLLNAPVELDAGHVFEIEDRITTDHPISGMLLTDPLPAGLQAVDTTFRTPTRAFEPSIDNWQIDYQRISHDRVMVFAQHLQAGVYAMRYLVRSITPGTFAWPAAEASPQYAPEDFGRTAMGEVRIR
jgi:uncharacterized protein YfaS (alpha-2-macroglobulin family)